MIYDIIPFAYSMPMVYNAIMKKKMKTKRRTTITEKNHKKKNYNDLGKYCKTKEMEINIDPKT